jgi:hypothetical protein
MLEAVQTASKCSLGVPTLIYPAAAVRNHVSCVIAQEAEEMGYMHAETKKMIHTNSILMKDLGTCMNGHERGRNSQALDLQALFPTSPIVGYKLQNMKGVNGVIVLEKKGEVEYEAIACS